MYDLYKSIAKCKHFNGLQKHVQILQRVYCLTTYESLFKKLDKIK
jgi:hypothetical protein